MMRLRLVLFDGSEVVERAYARLPVRIGRHPQNDCQVLDLEVSRFHAQIDCEGGELLVRDLGSQNGTLLRRGDGALGVMLRGSGSRSADGTLEFLMGSIRVRARLEEEDGCGLPDALVPAAQGATTALLDACEQVAGQAGTQFVREVIGGAFGSLLQIRLALHHDELDHGQRGSGAARRSRATAALLGWTQAVSVALRLIERSFDEAHSTLDVVEPANGLAPPSEQS